MSAASARAGGFAVAAVFACAIGYDLWRIPIQVSDSLMEILDAQRSPSAVASFTGSAGSAAYVRPLRIAQIKLVFDAAQGNYRLAYRGFHVLLLLALFWLFTRALQIGSAADLAAAIFALTVLTGLHTFAGFVREAFPINHFLEIAVLCAAALNLACSRGGWAVDLAAALLFVIAVLTLESGLLVWVVIAAAWLAGLRGVSMRGLAATTALLGVYFAVRFVYLDAGVPSLAERSSGFLLERLEPDELQARFGTAPLIFYGYNVAASVLSVLVSEPRDGVFAGVQAWMAGDVPPRVYAAIASSLATTALILWWAVGRWRRSGAPESVERLPLVAGAVLLASAALSFAYTKDEIMAVAGMFYAFGAYVAVRAAVARVASSRRAVVVTASMLLFVLASAWALRSISVHHVLQRQAFRVRNDWAQLTDRVRAAGGWPSDPASAALVEQLRNDAIDASVQTLTTEWSNRWLGD